MYNKCKKFLSVEKYKIIPHRKKNAKIKTKKKNLFETFFSFKNRKKVLFSTTKMYTHAIEKKEILTFT